MTGAANTTEFKVKKRNKDATKMRVRIAMNPPRSDRVICVPSKQNQFNRKLLAISTSGESLFYSSSTTMP
jgi:hypothetical protein